MAPTTSSDPLDRSSFLLVLFFVMHTFGWVGSLIILLTVTLSSRVERHAIWINLCIAWIISCISYSLILLSGQLYNPNPNNLLCLGQASAIYATPSLAAGATLSLAVYIWLLRCAPESRFMRYATPTLVAGPYIVPMALFVAVLIYGSLHPDQVVLADSMMYCGLSTGFAGKISAIFVTTAMVPTVVFEGLVISNVYRYRNVYPKLKGMFRTLFRICAFTFFGIFAVGISLVYLTSKSYGRLANVLMALPPVSFNIIFASQTDLLNVWMFWRRRPDNLENSTMGGDSPKLKSFWLDDPHQKNLLSSV